MKASRDRQGLGHGSWFRIRTRILLAMAGLSIACLILFGYISFTNILNMGYYAYSGIVSLGERAADDSTRALESLGQRMIEGNARDVAFQAAIYLASHPQMTVADLQRSPEFQRIAVQQVGDTGYTSIMDVDTGFFYFHPQERLVNTDTHEFAQTLPAVWQILDQTIGKSSDAAGYYDWQEADGSIRPKYMALTVIDGKTADNRRLFVASTTYIDEFSKPMVEARKNIGAATSEANVYLNGQIDAIRTGFAAVLAAFMLASVGVSIFLSRTVTKPVTALTETARSLERGDRFDPRRLAGLTKSGDELADLTRVFSQMASALEQRAEDERLASEARYCTLFDGVPVGLYRTAPSGEFLDVNPALAKMLGYPDKESLLGARASDIYVNADDRADWRTQLDRDGVTHGFEIQLRRCDGTIIWARHSASVVRDANGQVQYYDGGIEDITERKRAEEQLQESLVELEKQYRAAEAARGEVRATLDAANDGMILVSPGGQVLSVNYRFNQLFSRDDRVEMVGRNLDAFKEDMERVFTDGADFRRVVAESLPDREKHFTHVVTQRWPQARELQVSSTPVLSAHGDYLGRLYVFRDVTREREVDRMKSEFVSLVSHELRTPLTSIKGYVDLLLEGEVGEMPEEQQDFLGIIKSNADRLVALINDLLDISRIESGRVELKRSTLDLGRLVHSVASTLRPQIDAKGQRITLDLDAGLPLVSADADRVTQVLTNLVSNAHKYTPAGGSITVSARGEDGWVRVDVQDTGIGLSPAEQEQLFTKFFRAKNRVTQEVGGTGLGLPITKSLVEMHSGQMIVTSSPGQGSIFGFTLPVVEVQPAPEMEISIDLPTAGGRVLVVDDERDIADLVRRYLEHGGYQVSIAGNGKEALRMAREELPDLITLDIKLPDVDGFTVLEWLKHDPVTAAIPVLLLSTMADEGRGKVLGAVDYLSKPTNEQGLLDRVGKALARTQRRSVLVVDDDPDIRRLLVGYLRRADYQVSEAGNGVEALEMVKLEKPGLVLMDIKMPGMDGLTALRELRKEAQTQGLPVVMMTASPGALEESASAVETLGIAGLLNKPFTAEELASAIARGLVRGEQ